MRFFTEILEFDHHAEEWSLIGRMENERVGHASLVVPGIAHFCD